MLSLLLLVYLAYHSQGVIVGIMPVPSIFIPIIHAENRELSTAWVFELYLDRGYLSSVLL